VKQYPEGGGIVGPGGPVRIKNFAVDSISSRLCVTAVIDDFEELRLNIWDTNILSLQITANGSATTTYALLDGANYAPPNSDRPGVDSHGRRHWRLLQRQSQWRPD
jgi:hypothetical protein